MPQIRSNPPPWEALEPDLAALLRPGLPELVDEVLGAVREAVPAYRQPLEGAVGSDVRVRIEQALDGFLELIESGDEARVPARDLYVALGRGELRQGRSLDALLAAYRAGAQTSWRRLAARGDEVGLEPRVLYVLAEAIFAYIDELSAASAEGYAQEQSAAAGQRQVRRRRLLEMLSRTTPPAPAEVEAAAAGAEWPLPRTVGALEVASERSERVAAGLPIDVLAVPAEGVVHALVPDPEAPGRRGELERALDDERAALGPTVGWEQTARSVRRARSALELGGSRGARGLVVADEHLFELLLRQDRELGADLARQRLAPLASLGAGPRERLTETLRAWLDHQGEVRRVAERLHVHVQTVRYRVSQLRELFGPSFEDPRFRLELATALAVAEPGEA